MFLGCVLLQHTKWNISEEGKFRKLLLSFVVHSNNIFSLSLGIGYQLLYELL